MRKTISIFFAILYLVISSHTSLTVHKCFGQVKSISFFSNQELCCEDFDQKPPCCDDDVISFEDHSEEKLISSIHYELGASFVEFAHLSLISKQITRINQISFFFFGDSSPPASVPIFIKNCSLVLYA